MPVDAVLPLALVLLPLVYLATTAAYGAAFFASGHAAAAARRPLLATTFVLHLGFLLLLVARWHQFPAATVSQALSTTAFAVLTVYAVVEWRSGESATGFFMLVPAFLFVVLGSLLPTGAPPDREIFHSPLFAVHTSCALLGYAGFVLAAGYGFLFLGLYRDLKRRRFVTFFGKLPPLEALDSMMTVALTVGFVALTGAVATGAVWASRLLEERWIDDPKILVTLVTWGFYGAALLLRRARQWQGRQTAVASLAGFAAILFSFVAVNLFFTQMHDFQ